MNKTMMRAVLELAMFLALSDDDVINPDIAVTQLEQLASILGELTTEERDEFIEYSKELASTELSAGNLERSEFLLSVADNLGLTTD